MVSRYNKNQDIFIFLESKVNEYNSENFIESDPVRIPHLFERKEDIEISGFLTATISWGQRKNIIKSAEFLMQLMDYEPYEFILNADEKDLEHISRFYYRTFNATDIMFFVRSLQNIYKNKGGLENILVNEYRKTGCLMTGIMALRDEFFKPFHQKRSEKHFSNIRKGASGKRLNMFLRWMVRKDDRGVDFGIWNNISASDLYIPLDVHSGQTARKLGILTRKQNDWKAVVELTEELRKFDPEDPVKYDYALFALGVFEKF